MTFSDVTKQNDRPSVGTLFRKVLGEIVFPMIAFINLKKGEGEAYIVCLCSPESSFLVFNSCYIGQLPKHLVAL